MSMVSLKNISYTYPLEDKESIHHLSFDFKEGKCLWSDWSK
ncbi:hypothetical protein SPD48_02335 [Pseudogracilibacillus sp. SE30717A]